MTATPPPEFPAEKAGPGPSDLSELTATDALLDRLGGRRASAADLADPAVAALSELLAEIDEARAPDAGAARLVEVLAGRPLYIAGADLAAPAAGSADAVADAEPLAGPRVIDLTGRGPESAAPRPVAVPDRAVETSEPAEPEGDPLVPAARRADGVVPIGLAASRSRAARLRGRVPLSAAAVVALVALGSGVGAAVTGDVLAPVNGISRVMAQLPGVSSADDGRRHLTDRVRGEITAADQAVAVRDAPSANLHLAAARRGLGGVPPSDQPNLSAMIDSVQSRITTSTATPVAPSSPPELGITPTSEPASEPPPAPTTSAPADPPPTTESSPDPVPTTAEATPEPSPTAIEAESPSTPDETTPTP